MSKRRYALRQLAYGYVSILASGIFIPVDAEAQSAPMLNESELEAKSIQYTVAAPGSKKCVNCQNFSRAPEQGTGFCKTIPGKRVYAAGVCVKFYAPKN